jgi:hypothetical protein
MPPVGRIALFSLLQLTDGFGDPSAWHSSSAGEFSCTTTDLVELSAMTGGSLILSATCFVTLLLMPWDKIHQIVSRFLERFRYMCPLLFSCVFPS